MRNYEEQLARYIIFQSFHFRAFPQKKILQIKFLILKIISDCTLRERSLFKFLYVTLYILTFILRYKNQYIHNGNLHIYNRSNFDLFVFRERILYIYTYIYFLYVYISDKKIFS